MDVFILYCLQGIYDFDFSNGLCNQLIPQLISEQDSDKTVIINVPNIPLFELF